MRYSILAIALGSGLLCTCAVQAYERPLLRVHSHFFINGCVFDTDYLVTSPVHRPNHPAGPFTANVLMTTFGDFDNTDHPGMADVLTIPVTARTLQQVTAAVSALPLQSTPISCAIDDGGPLEEGSVSITVYALGDAPEPLGDAPTITVTYQYPAPPDEQLCSPEVRAVLTAVYEVFTLGQCHNP
jgi:hypothetical protein